MKKIFLEIYSLNIKNNFDIRQPISLQDALDFVDRILPDPCFADVYLDVCDDGRACWQQSFSMIGVESRDEVRDFLESIWTLI